MSRLMTFFATTALSIAVVSCDSDPSAPPSATTPVASVRVSPPQTELLIGQSVRLTAQALAAHGAPLSMRSITWNSESEDVATVSAHGLVEARSAGTATVVASSEGKQGRATIVVSAPPVPAVASVSLDVTAVAMEEGATRQLIATPRDAQGSPIAGLGITWTSSEADIAPVSAAGLVTGVRPGSATITATVHGKSAQASVAISASYGYDLLYTVRTFDIFREIFRLDLRSSGTAPSRLFPAQRWASEPRPSPDGTRIAYVAPNPIIGDPSIFVANRDGSGATMVAAFIGESFGEPTWSPDGARLAYDRTKNDGVADHSHIWVMNADGSSQVALTVDLPGSQNMPAWSPRPAGGTERIAYVQDVNARPRVWSMRPDGSDRRRLGTAADVHDIQPAWSPDGLTIVLQRSAAGIFGDLWVMSADGSNERALMPFATLGGAQSSPAWSPDGKLIAFTSSHETASGGTAPDQVYTVWADGTKLARRTFDTGAKANPKWLSRP
jgi:Tol biopolymer transport system component